MRSVACSKRTSPTLLAEQQKRARRANEEPTSGSGGPSSGPLGAAAGPSAGLPHEDSNVGHAGVVHDAGAQAASGGARVPVAVALPGLADVQALAPDAGAHLERVVPPGVLDMGRAAAAPGTAAEPAAGACLPGLDAG